MCFAEKQRKPRCAVLCIADAQRSAGNRWSSKTRRAWKPSTSPKRLSRNPAWAELAFPSRDLIDLEPYRSAWLNAHGYFSTNMVASRGCPYRCNWCAKPISGNKFHLRPAAAVAEEMRLLKVQAGVDHIWFGDDVFALNHHWVKEFAEEVVKRNAAVPFKIQSRADLMSEQTVQHLKTAGCAEVWMGVESGSQAVLNAMDKGLSLPAVVAARAPSERSRYSSLLFSAVWLPWRNLDRIAGNDRALFVRRARTTLASPSRIHCRERCFMTVCGRNLDKSATGPTAMISASCSKQHTKRFYRACAMLCMRKSTRGANRMLGAPMLEIEALWRRVD